MLRTVTVLAVAVATSIGIAIPYGGSVEAHAASALDLAGRVFVLNPGHNGGNGAHPEVINDLVWSGTAWKACDTTGTATNAGYSEHAHNWDVAMRARQLLSARGATVLFTRDSDTGVGPCITTRAEIGNRAGADAVVSIHADGNLASGARGFHVIVGTAMVGGSSVEAASATLARVLRDRFADDTGMPYSTYLGGGDAIDVRNDLGGINLSAVPALFIETGNMRSPTDAALLSSSTFRQREAVAIAAALGDFVGNTPPHFPSDGDGDGVPARLVHGPLDFGGNGRADAVRANGAQWSALDGGQGSWRTLRASQTTLRSLGFGDFTGDGRTDVLYANGTTWSMASAGTASFTPLQTSPYRLGELALGDFDGDRRTDVFRATGTAWVVSSHGTGPWRILRTTNAALPTLAFADIDGDGRTDVIQATGTLWRASSGGTSPFTTLRTTATRLEELAFADVTGDGRDDAIYSNGRQWLMSSAARGAWEVLRETTDTLRQAGLADVTGDGRADAIRATSTGWQVGRSATGAWEPLNGSAVPIGGLAVG